MKLFGLVFLLVGCTLLGFFAARREKKGIIYAVEVKRLLEHMCEQISEYRTPLDDIYLSFDSKLLDNCGFSEELSPDIPAYKAWEMAVKRLPCRKEVKDILNIYGRNLGLRTADDENTSLKKAISGLEKYILKANEEYPSKRKVYLSLGFTVGAVIFIVMI